MMKSIWKITFLAIVCITLFVPTLGSAAPQAHLWLNSVGDFPDDGQGYTTTETNFTLYIANEAEFGADTLILIISLPGRTNDVYPTDDNVTIDGVTLKEWEWGIPNITTENCEPYIMPRSNCFPTYYLIYDIGGISSEDMEYVDVKINGTPPVRFDAWGLDETGCIILKNPFSHNLTHVPEFSTIALPIAAIIGIMFILQSRRRKED